MTRLYLIIIFSFSISFSQNTGGSLAFMNISPTANSRSLGYTIASEMHKPAALLLSPANIWQYSNMKVSVNDMSLSRLDDLTYNNIFLSKKVNDWTFGAGGINFGVKRIEEYDEDAVFEGYFNYQSKAMMFGVANKISNFIWGLGISMMDEGFSKFDSNKNTHIGLDLGVTFLDVKISNLYFTGGMSSKSIIAGTDKTNSAYSTSSVFTKISSIFIDTDVIKLSINGFGDFHSQQYLNRYYVNMGIQGSASIKDFFLHKVYLNSGLSNIPILAEGDDYISYLLNNKKFSIGAGIEITPPNNDKWKVNIQYAQVFDSYYESKYFSCNFIKRK